MPGQHHVVRPRAGRWSVVFSLLLAVFVVFIVAGLPGRAHAQGVRRGTVSVGPPVVVRENGRTFLRRGPASGAGKVSHHPSRLIVKFRPGKAAALLPGSPGARAFVRQPGLFLVQVPPGVTVEEAVRRYAQRPDVLYAEPDSIVSANADPNDPRWSVDG